MKKALIIGLIAVLSFFIYSCGRKSINKDALKIGSTDVPKNLMPYASTDSVNMFACGYLYDTLLGSSEDIDDENNYFKFTDNLCYANGAYPKDGSDFGYELFNPTEDEYNAQLQRKNIVFQRDEAGNFLDETIEQFNERSEEAVPKKNWIRYNFLVSDRFSWNDGVKFSASDIEFTFKYVLKYKGALASIAYFLNNYYSCEAKSDTNFELVLATNKLSDIKTICNSIFILPKHIWNGIVNPAEQKNMYPVGTGPYKVNQGDFIDDTSLTLTLRDDYDEQMLKEMMDNKINKIFITRISNMDVMLNALEKGDIDVSLDTLTNSKAKAIMNNSSYRNTKISSYTSSFVTTLAFNVGKNGCFKGENGYTIRKAISLVIDQEKIINDILQGDGIKINDGLTLPSYPYALKDSNGNYLEHEYNVELANEMLDKIGYTKNNGKRNLSFSILASPANEALVYEIKNIVNEKLGINIEFELATSTYSEDIKQSNNASFDMIINTVTFDVDQLLMFDARFGIYPTGSPRVWNCTGVNDPTLSSLMKDMDTEMNILEQYKKAILVQNRLSELCVETPLYCSMNYNAYSEKNFTGWTILKNEGILNSQTIKNLKRVN